MKRIVCILSLCVLSSTAEAACQQSDNTITCDTTVALKTWGTKLHSSQGLYPISAFNNFNVHVGTESTVNKNGFNRPSTNTGTYVGALLGIGFEIDLNRSKRNNFRPTAMAELYYDPKMNHRISANSYFSQQPNVSKTNSNYVLRYELSFLKKKYHTLL